MRMCVKRVELERGRVRERESRVRECVLLCVCLCVVDMCFDVWVCVGCVVILCMCRALLRCCLCQCMSIACLHVYILRAHTLTEIHNAHTSYIFHSLSLVLHRNVVAQSFTQWFDSQHLVDSAVVVGRSWWIVVVVVLVVIVVGVTLLGVVVMV